MKGFSAVSLLFLFLTIVNGAEKQELVSYAINGILRKHFINRTTTVDLVSFGATAKLGNELIEKIVKANSNSFSFRVQQRGQNYSCQLNESSIVLFDSVESLRYANGRIRWATNRKTDIQTIVYVENGTVNDVHNNIQDGFSIDNVAFLIKKNKKSISLVSSYMFRPNNCRVKQLLTINRFHRNTMSWKNSNFYPNKYRNFHNCTLMSFDIKVLYDSKYNADVGTNAIVALTRNLNFTIKFVNPLEPDSKRPLPDFFSAALNYNYSSQGFNVDFMKICIEFYRENDILVVPPGEPYSDLDRMFLMFDIEVWIAIGVTLSIWFLLIQVINRMPMNVQNFVYGRNIRTPTMNMADIFLNGGQDRVPESKFAKYLLMLFVIWSLIIRTCYQSMLYDYLQKDLRKPPVEVIEGLLANNFTFYDCRYSEYPLHFKIQDEFYVNNSECLIDTDEKLNALAEPENKAAMIISTGYVRSVENHAYRSGSSSLIVTQEVVSHTPVGITLMYYSSYYETFNDKILRLQASGLIDHWAKKHENPKGIKRVQEDIGPQVMTMSHIGIGLIACLAPLPFILVVFVSEIMTGFWKKLQRHLKDPQVI